MNHKNNSPKTVKRSVTLTADDYEKLKRLAAKKHGTVADVLREFIAEGFARYALDESSSAIKVAISQTLQDILPPMLEKANQKLTSVCWKAVRNSAAAMYLAEEAYQTNSTDPRSEVEIMADGISAGADYCHFRPLSREQYLAEAQGFFKGSDGSV
ncbi:MAG: hypothetical protein ACI4RK_05855 [Oscillospiraceae bacterium]